MQVSDLMRVHVNSVQIGDSLALALNIFDLYQQQIIPVIDVDGQVCGILSARAITNFILTSSDATLDADKPVDNFMHLDFESLRPESHLSEASKALAASDDGVLIVLDHDQHLVGLLTAVSLARAKVSNY